MRKLQLSGLMLALLVAPGCGSSGDDDDDDDVIAIDADTSTPDATQGPDATPGASAVNLGQPCGGVGGVMCPGGERCVTLQGFGSQTEGFCTIPCLGQTDTVSCSNGYTGGGMPRCALDDMMDGFSCAVLCTIGGSGECAIGTVCTDADGTGICTGDE